MSWRIVEPRKSRCSSMGFHPYNTIFNTFTHLTFFYIQDGTFFDLLHCVDRPGVQLEPFRAFWGPGRLCLPGLAILRIGVVSSPFERGAPYARQRGWKGQREVDAQSRLKPPDRENPFWAVALRARALGRDPVRAKGIMASGACQSRIERPDTWPPQPAESSTPKNPCQRRAVHTRP